MPAARALSSPSGEAAEDNVVERGKFWGGRNYGITELRVESLQSLFLRIESFFLKILLSNPNFSKVHERTKSYQCPTNKPSI